MSLRSWYYCSILLLILGFYCVKIDSQTTAPTHSPTDTPTHVPTDPPTFPPTRSPTYVPTHPPTNSPTYAPTHTPTCAPTHTPTDPPTFPPTRAPTTPPSRAPTYSPTTTHAPSYHPTIAPTTLINGIYVDELTRQQGFSILGTATGTSSGSASTGQYVSNGGDINGDGYDDLLILNSGLATVTVLFGNATKPASSYNVHNLDSTTGTGPWTGFTIDGTGMNVGNSVTSAGDLNNDGYDDILIGTSSSSQESYCAYVIYGRKSFGSLTTLVLSSQLYQYGFVIQAGTAFCKSVIVGNAGDVNGDHFDDILLGTETGTYLIFGSTTTSLGSSMTLGSLSSEGVVFTGDSTQGSNYVTYGKTAGDVNRDGYDDILLATATSVFLVYGNKTWSSTPSSSPSTTTPSIIVTIGSGVSGFISSIGYSTSNLGSFNVISTAQDYNGDGYSDFMVGYPSINKVFLFFGQSAYYPTSMEATTQLAQYGISFSTPTGDTGLSVSNAGDVNHDGYDDLIMGSPYFGTFYIGRAYVIYGMKSSSIVLGSNTDLTTLTDQSLGFTLLYSSTTTMYDYLGNSVAGGMDFNGDGYADVLCGAHGYSNYAGAAYFVYGNSSLSTNSVAPTMSPTLVPTAIPSYSKAPVHPPTSQPSRQPSGQPSSHPTMTYLPTLKPTNPTYQPTMAPTIKIGEWSMSSAPNTSWTSIAISSNGQNIVATSASEVYTSSDYGTTWQLKIDLTIAFPSFVPEVYNDIKPSIASDTTGEYIICSYPSNLIVYSSNYGVTWSSINPLAPSTSNAMSWNSVAMNGNGSYLFAVALYLVEGIYISSNYGVTWFRPNVTVIPSPDTSVDIEWSSITCDTTGQYVIAIADVDHGLYRSTNYGHSFTHIPNLPTIDWLDVAICGNGPYMYGAGYGGIYLSNDYGETWKMTNAFPFTNWFSVTCDSSGALVQALIIFGGIYSSSDYGATWTLTSELYEFPWESIASDSTGSHVVAAMYEVGIFVNANSNVVVTDDDDAGGGGNNTHNDSDENPQLQRLIAISFAIIIGSLIWITSLFCMLFRTVDADFISELGSLPIQMLFVTISAFNSGSTIYSLINPPSDDIGTVSYISLLTSRCFVAVCWMIFVVVFVLPSASIADKENGNVALSMLYHKPSIQKSFPLKIVGKIKLPIPNGPIYAIALTLSIFDLTHLRLLPWLRTTFTKVSKGYPNLFTMRLTMYGMFLASLIQFVASVMRNDLKAPQNIVLLIVSCLNVIRSFVSMVMYLQAARSNKLKLIVVNEKDLAKLASLERGEVDDLEKDEEKQSLEDDYSPKAISNTLNKQLQGGTQDEVDKKLDKGKEDSKNGKNSNDQDNVGGKSKNNSTPVDIELVTMNPVVFSGATEVNDDSFIVVERDSSM